MKYDKIWQYLTVVKHCFIMFSFPLTHNFCHFFHVHLRNMKHFISDLANEIIYAYEKFYIGMYNKYVKDTISGERLSMRCLVFN